MAVANYFYDLPIELQTEVYKYVFNDIIKPLDRGGCYCNKTWSTWCTGGCQRPSFTALNYIRFRPYNPNYSGAREIASYIEKCWGIWVGYVYDGDEIDEYSYAWVGYMFDALNDIINNDICYYDSEYDSDSDSDSD